MLVHTHAGLHRQQAVPAGSHASYRTSLAAACMTHGPVHTRGPICSAPVLPVHVLPIAGTRAERHPCTTTRLAPPRAAASEGGAEGAPAFPTATYTTLYGILTAVFGLLAAVFAIAPGWAIQCGLRVASPEPAAVAFMGVFSSYCVAAAGICVCLKNATQGNRLQSDTYKRMNLCLGYWCIILIVLQIRSKAITNPALLCGYLAVCLPTIFTTFTAYRASNGGVFAIPQILKGFLSGIKEAAKPQTLVAGVYALLMLPLAGFWPTCTFTDAHPLILGDMSPVGQYIKRKAGSGMLLLLVMHYNLKSAADRGRLGASTFRVLNLTLGAACAVGGYWFYQMYQTAPVNNVLMIPLLVDAAVSTVLFDVLYLRASSQPS